MRALVSLLMVAVVSAACAVVPSTPPEVPSSGPTGPEVRIARTPDSEGQLLAGVLAELVATAGMQPVLVDRADPQAARRSLAPAIADADLLVGYTGQTWLEVLGRANPPGDPRVSFARVRNADEPDGILWLRPDFELERGPDGPPANATFGLFVRGVPHADGDIRTIEQLASRLAERPDARVCVDREFGVRPDGWAGLAAAYGIADRPLTSAPAADAVKFVAAGDCLVGLSSATDGDAWRYGLWLLADPLGVFPAFVVAVQMRTAARDEIPGLMDAVAPFTQHLTTRRLGQWNGRVAGGEDLGVVARDAAEELLEAAQPPPPSEPPTPSTTPSG